MESKLWRLRIWGAGAMLVLATLAGETAAQSPDERIAEWIAAAERAELRPIEQSEVARRHARFRDSLAALDQYLKTGGPQKEQSWKRYLLWDQLENVARSSSLPESAVVDQLGARLYSGFPGLELPPFAQLRESLAAYVGMSRAQGEPRLAEAFARQREALQGALREYADAPSSRSRLALAELLEWFDSVGQVPELVEGVRQAHRSPNFFVYASDRLVNEVVAQPVDEVRPLTDCILGTYIRGTTHMRGQVSASLIPSSHAAAFAIHLTGSAHSNSVGYRRPVNVYSQSTTALSAQKAFYLDQGGLVAQAAHATASTHTHIHGISTQKRLASNLIERIAWNRALEQKPQAEQIAAQHAAQRLEEAMDERGATMQSEANERMRGELRRPLARRGLYPQQIAFSTSTNYLTARAVQAEPRQLAALLPPSPGGERRSLTMLIHESLVNNSAETALGGLELSDTEAARVMEELTGSVPESLQTGPDRERWSITFAHRQPITVAFQDDMVEIALEGRRFKRDDETLARRIRIAARYCASVAPEGVRLVRDGELLVTFPGREGEQLSVRELAFKTFMENRFEELFKAEFQGKGMELPGRLERLGRRTLDYVSARDGWLNLGWN